MVYISTCIPRYYTILQENEHAKFIEMYYLYSSICMIGIGSLIIVQHVSHAEQNIYAHSSGAPDITPILLGVCDVRLAIDLILYLFVSHIFCNYMCIFLIVGILFFLYYSSTPEQFCFVYWFKCIWFYVYVYLEPFVRIFSRLKQIFFFLRHRRHLHRFMLQCSDLF